MQLSRYGVGLCAGAASVLVMAVSGGAQKVPPLARPPASPRAVGTAYAADALDSLIAAALAASPLAHAAQARVAAAAARIGPAGARPDPMLMAGVQNLPVTAPGFTDEMTMVMVGVGQTVPLRGKLAVRRRAAERDVEAARAELERARLEVVRDVRIAYYDLAYLDRAIALIARNRDVLVELVRVAEARYGSVADRSAGSGQMLAAPSANGMTTGLGTPATSAGAAWAGGGTRSTMSDAGGGASRGMGMGAGTGMAGMGRTAGAKSSMAPTSGMPVMAAGATTMGAASAAMTSGSMGGGGMRSAAAMTGGALQEVLRARVEVTRLAEDASALLEERRAVLARLNASLDRPSDVPVDAPTIPARIARAAVADSAQQIRFASATLGARAADSPLPGLEVLQQRVAERSPSIRVHEALITAQTARVELARRERVPDVDVALQYGARPRYPDMLTATVSVPIPVQRGRVQDQIVAGARAELTALEAEHHRQLNDHRAEVARLHADAERARTRLALLKRAVIPHAQAVRDAGFAAYQAGHVGLSAVLEARASVFNQETAYYRTLSDFAKAVAELEFSVGAEVLP